MGGTSCLLPLLHVGIFLAWVCVGLVHADTIVVISYVHLPWCAQKTLFSLRDLSPLPLTIILASLSINFPWALKVRFMIEIPLRAEPYKVPCSVYIDQLWVSVLTTTCCKKKLLWWGLNERGFKKSRTLWWRSKWQIILTGGHRSQLTQVIWLKTEGQNCLANEPFFPIMHPQLQPWGGIF